MKEGEKGDGRMKVCFMHAAPHPKSDLRALQMSFIRVKMNHRQLRQRRCPWIVPSTQDSLILSSPEPRTLCLPLSLPGAPRTNSLVLARNGGAKMKPIVSLECLLRTEHLACLMACARKPEGPCGCRHWGSPEWGKGLYRFSACPACTVPSGCHLTCLRVPPRLAGAGPGSPSCLMPGLHTDVFSGSWQPAWPACQVPLGWSGVQDWDKNVLARKSISNCCNLTFCLRK